jgi:hypothetical protein
MPTRSERRITCGSRAPNACAANGEAADHGDVGRHHRDLAELRQRDRHRELQRFGEFDREMTAGNDRRGLWRDRRAFNFFERGHCNRLAPPRVEKVTARAAA